MKHISCEILEKKIAVLTYSNPPVNALGLEEKKEWIQVLNELNENPEIAVIIIRSGTKGFSAGSNVKEFAQYDEEGWRAYQAVDTEFMGAIQYSKVPIIAAVHGFAIAMGCAVAAMCDIVIATPDAKFGMPEIKVGAIGGEDKLARLMPDKLAHYLALTGNYVTAQDIFPYGQILKLVPEESLLEEALAVAREIAANYVKSVRYVKDCITRRVPNQQMEYIQTFADEYSRRLIGDKERLEMLSEFGGKNT